MLNSLLNKIKIIFIVSFLFASIVFYFTLKNFHEEEARLLVQEDIFRLEAMHEFISKHQKPAIYNLLKEANLSKDYFEPSLMSSTYIIGEVNDIFKKNHLNKSIKPHEHVEYKFASDNPTNPINKATLFESEVLKKFNDSNITSYSKKILHNGKDTLFYALPVSKNSESCLRCHGNPKDAPKRMIAIYGDKSGFNEKVGDIRAIDAVYSTIDANNSMVKFFTMIEILMLSIFLVIYFTVRYFVIQLNNKDIFIAKQSKFAAMGEMISMIAHQWRQPLTGISITANNLLLDVELEDIDEKRLKENLESINKQTKYLSNTIDDFRNFFKPNMVKEKVNLHNLIEDSCMIINSSIKNNGIELKLNIDKKLTIFTMKNDITQIILNLVKNSMDAYNDNNIEKRVIEIAAIDKVDKIEINFKDYAGGIPDDIIDKIFDPYFSTKDEKNGTGLGLYMSKMIIEDHLFGFFSVKTEGEITIFTIELSKKEI